MIHIRILKNSLQEKGVAHIQNGPCKKVVKPKVAAKKWLRWWLNGKKNYINNSGEFCADSGMRQHKFTLIVIVKSLPLN